MKKVVFRIFIFILLLTTSVFAKDKICLTNGEWPPYLSKKLPYNGFASHIVKEAFNAVDMDVEYIFLPWKRAYISAKLGFVGEKICHGTLVWVYTKDRAEDFTYSDIVITDAEILYFLKESPIEWNKVEDLNANIIGGTLHTVYPTFEMAEKKGILKIHRAGNYDVLFNRLLSYRIDAIPQVKRVGDFFLKTNLSKEQRERIAFSNTVIQKREYHLIFSKKIEENKKYLKLFNKGLEIIKNNGRYEELLKNFDNGFYDKY